MRKMKRKKLRSMYAKPMSATEDFSTVECANVWDVICDTKEEAADMRARTYLLSSILKTIDRRNWKLAEAAGHCGVTQERIQALRRGRVSRFTQAELHAIADRLEHAPGLQAGPAQGIIPGYEDDEGPLSERALREVRDLASSQMPKGKRLAKKILVLVEQ